jgi:hypothetical protein
VGSLTVLALFPMIDENRQARASLVQTVDVVVIAGIVVVVDLYVVVVEEIHVVVDVAKPLFTL